MPTASDELREEWEDDGDAISFLERAGYKLDADWCWTVPGREPTEQELRALRYLVDEWDFGWIKEGQLKTIYDNRLQADSLESIIKYIEEKGWTWLLRRRDPDEDRPGKYLAHVYVGSIGNPFTYKGAHEWADSPSHALRLATTALEKKL